MALVSILLVLIYKQPYKKINEETMVQSAASEQPDDRKPARHRDHQVQRLRRA